jgi:hypothetical protein
MQHHAAVLTACTAGQLLQLASSTKQALQDNKAQYPVLAASWQALCIMEGITGLEIKVDSANKCKQLEAALPQQFVSSNNNSSKAKATAPEYCISWADMAYIARFGRYVQQAALDTGLWFELDVSPKHVAFVHLILQLAARKAATQAAATAAATSAPLSITTGSMAASSTEMESWGITSSDSVPAACTAMVPYTTYSRQYSMASSDISTSGTELYTLRFVPAVSTVPDLHTLFLDSYKTFISMEPLGRTAPLPLRMMPVPESLTAPAVVVASAMVAPAESSVKDVAFEDLLAEANMVLEQGRQLLPLQSVQRSASTYINMASTTATAATALVNSYTAPASNQYRAAVAPARLSTATATSNRWQEWLPIRVPNKKTGGNVVATSVRATARGASPTRQHNRARSPQRSMSPPRQLEPLERRPVTAAAAAAIVAMPEPVQATPVQKTLGQLVAKISVAELERSDGPCYEVSHWTPPQRTLPQTPRRGINNRAAQLSPGITSPVMLDRLHMAPLQLPQEPVQEPVPQTATLGTALITMAGSRRSSALLCSVECVVVYL